MPEIDLTKLLRNIKPQLLSGQYVFCTVAPDEAAPLSGRALCLFREEEGISLILEQSRADEENLSYSEIWSLITCKVISDLQAVGFLAAITQSLATAGIPVNPVSAFYHDHLFVPSSRADEALALIERLSQTS